MIHMYILHIVYPTHTLIFNLEYDKSNPNAIILFRLIDLTIQLEDCLFLSSLSSKKSNNRRKLNDSNKKNKFAL